MSGVGCWLVIARQPMLAAATGVNQHPTSDLVCDFTLFEHDARVGRNMDSGLEECYKSLANVQSPSRSHADLGAFAPMTEGP